MKSISHYSSKKLIDWLEFLGRGQSPAYTEDESSLSAINQKCVRNGAVDVSFSRGHDPKIRIKDSAKLKEGDVCVNSTGTGTIGRIGLWRAKGLDPTIRYFADSHVTIARPQKNTVNPKFLSSILETFPLQNAIESFCLSGSTNQVELNRAAFCDLIISLPDKPVQDQIATILSTIDKAIEQTEAIIAKQQRIKTGLMQDFLTRGIDEHGNIRSEQTHQFKDSPLGRIPVEWECEPCSAICKNIVVGIVIRPAQYYRPSGIPVLRSANITDSGIDLSDIVYMSEADNVTLAKSCLRQGDLVTVRTGYPGTTAVIPPELDDSNCVDIIISRPNLTRIRPNYLAIWINSDFGKKQVLEGQGGLAQQHFNVGELRKLIVKVPSIEEQSKIEDVLLLQEELITRQKRVLNNSIRLKTGLMQDLLTGKVRVTELLKQQSTLPNAR